MSKLKAVVHWLEDKLYIAAFWTFDREFRWRFTRIRLLNKLDAPPLLQHEAIDGLDRYMKRRYFSRIAK